MMLRAVVADHEPGARETVRRLAAARRVEIVAECESGPQALAAVRAHGPDLLLLDVPMPGMNGLEVVRRLGAHRRPTVVFTTAHSEYAVQAFGLDAADYLLKPFDGERFSQALERARRALAGQGAATPSGRQPAPATRLLVTSRDRMMFVDVSDVHWIAAEGKYVRLHTAAGAYLLRDGINRMEARLDARRFLRIHRSTLVNVRRIKEMFRGVGDDFVVRLHDGVDLSMSRRYRARIREMA